LEVLPKIVDNLPMGVGEIEFEDGNSGMRRRMEDIPLLLFANGVELKLY